MLPRRQPNFATPICFSAGPQRTYYLVEGVNFNGLMSTLTLVETCELGWWYSANSPAAPMIVALMADIDLMRACCWSAPEATFETASFSRDGQVALVTGAGPPTSISGGCAPHVGFLPCGSARSTRRLTQI